MLKDMSMTPYTGHETGETALWPQWLPGSADFMPSRTRESRLYGAEIP